MGDNVEWLSNEHGVSTTRNGEVNVFKMHVGIEHYIGVYITSLICNPVQLKEKKGVNVDTHFLDKIYPRIDTSLKAAYIIGAFAI